MWYWKPYTTVAELMEKAERTAARLKTAEPVLPHPHTRKICLTWWGEAWCKNLESYADYESRLGRGRRYFRAKAVVDLKIRGNVVKAKVQGTEQRPYQITITFETPKDKNIQAITEKLSNRITNIDDLIKGNFPEDLKELFTQKKPGLFPSPNEIHFDCNCYDWADMCKHVAAVMYAIGVKIDDDPSCLFELRGVDMNKFINAVIKDKVEEMLKNVNKKSDRIIKNADVSAIFGL
ncbi:MAG: hypothetical protein IKN12_13480 [Selenomonadaceae bacterium]|nr:hypothetical protein [Selenomonadaceae bacterium]